MANSSIVPIFCNNIGNATDGLQCCYPQDQDGLQCQEIFEPNSSYLQYPYGDWITGCQDPSVIYSSLIQLNQTGNNRALFRRYNTCANVPAIISYSSQGVLSPAISSSVTNRFSHSVTEANLQNVTAAVTDCVTETCRHSRNRARCYDYCAPVRLLTNNTIPNVLGLNNCLDILCSGGDKSLPYADADVIGIGVFASYIMQCIFVVLLFLGFLGFEISSKRPKSKAPSREDNPSSETAKVSDNQDGFNKKLENFTSLLTDFHKAQCYFSGTLQIASLSYGIFQPNMLVTFMLIPLATNGVLPVAFTYLLLVRWRQAGMGLALLTVACWILSSIVYWVLYTGIIHIDSNLEMNHSYQQFFYKLSAIPACGNYSALALCQNNFWIGKESLHTSLRKLRALTPIIWTFSTVCLIGILGYQVYRFFEQKNLDNPKHSEKPEKKIVEKNEHQVPTSHSIPGSSALFWLATICFLAGIGMQLSLLAIGTSLNIIDLMGWSFGQIVAVTIWVPPLLEYLYVGIATSRLPRSLGMNSAVRRGD